MKLALLADAHANLPALEAVFADILSQHIDHIVFAGDAVGYYPFVNEVCDLLRQHSSWSVSGNHDAFVTGKLNVPEGRGKAYAHDYSLNMISAENMMWLRSLPEHLDLELSGKIFRIFHGSPWRHLEEYIYPDYRFFERFEGLEADFVVLGHTHYPMVKRVGETIIINPGSCGQPRDYNPDVSYAVLDVLSGSVDFRRLAYDVKRVLDAAGRLDFDAAALRILTRSR